MYTQQLTFFKHFYEVELLVTHALQGVKSPLRQSIFTVNGLMTWRGCLHSFPEFCLFPSILSIWK